VAITALYAEGRRIHIEEKKVGRYKPGHREVCRWIAQANESLRTDMIVRGILRLVLPADAHSINDEVEVELLPEELDDAIVLDSDSELNSDHDAEVE